MASLITAERLHLFAADANPGIVAALIDGAAALDAAGVNSPVRTAHFLAQIAVETGGLKHLEENLSYSAERLHAVFPKRFPTIASAEPFAHNPQALANKIYGGRLGNNAPDDGWRYRGGGMMQTTGRDNYRAAGFEANPDVLRTPGPALTSALKYWSDHHINAIADTDNVTAVREAVNGGTIGLADCKIYLSRARGALAH